MSRVPLSSGDPIADRRFAHARDYAARGEPGAAAEVAEQALERVPGWAPGWFLLGEFREAEDAREAAVAAFERAAALDPEDRCGAGPRLARLGARPAPTTLPPAHVRDLFDAYAPRFERSLVDRLGYRGPELVATAIEAVAGERRFGRGLDIGCGTGLMARALAGRVARLDGVDLAPTMVTIARASGLYGEVVVGDAASELERRPSGSLDLVTAADVFCYVGDFRAITTATARALAPGGLFGFTVEAGGAGDELRLVDSLRFTHGRGYIAAALTAAGLDLAHLAEGTLRRDRDQDIPAFVVVAARP
ncbi:MAG: methyltransferase domain-containing protein [Phyllobacteriaceae bacterium]|nr:methyltransferase domain-containing protein [Phyllobacteriaceae bacterium]